MKKHFLFLGFAIPDEEMDRVLRLDRSPAIQTHKFNWNLIRGIQTCESLDFTYISTRPISDYPLFPERIIRGNRWHLRVLDREIEITEIPFVNLGIFKIVTRFLSGLYYSLSRYHGVRDKGGVVVYSVHVPFMAIGYIVSRVYSIDYIAIWTDPPSVRSETDGRLKSSLRSLERLLSRFVMKRATKVIAVTRYLAEDFAPNRPYLVMEGIVDERHIDPKIRKTGSNEVKVVYTGSLAKRYGVQNIVEGFLLVDDCNIVLEMYGRGDYEEELVKICSENKRVRYKGFIPNEEVLAVQSEADFLINARSPDDEYTRYSFPSKTLEYMMSGTPLITTVLPGMPEEYRNYVIPLSSNDPQTIGNTLKQAVRLEKEERISTGLRALEFAKTKGYVNQGRRLCEFLS